MRRTGMSVVILALLALTQMATADTNVIQVTGNAELKQQPDLAFVTVYFSGEGMLMSDAVQAADEKQEKILKAATEFAAELQAEVSDMSIGNAPSADMWSTDGGKPAQPGISRQVRWTLPPDPAKIYGLLDILIRAGASLTAPSSNFGMDEESVVVYGVSESPELERQLEAAAVADASARADSLAASVGKAKGEVLGVGCNSGTEMNHFVMMGGPKTYPTKHLGSNSKEITLRRSLTVTYSLATIP